MHKRRQILITLGSALATGGAVGLNASFTSTATAEADFRIVTPRGGRLLRLTPANDPFYHVATDDDGRVTAITPGGDGHGVNEAALTHFDDIVDVTNVGSTDIDGLYFEFEAESDTLSASTIEKLENAISMTAAGETLDTTGEPGDDLFEVSPDESVEDGTLAPGDSVSFGIQIDLIPEYGASSLSDLPDSNEYDATLRLITEQNE
jgi:hypothetical protein